MRYSIIIPSYNQAEFLQQSIESALNQHIKAEVIVVDDGSTDGSLAVARQYEPHITVVSQVNKGLASARNTGIMNATGDWIIPLDSDDYLREDATEVIDKLILHRPDADIVGVSIRCFGISDVSQILIPEPTLADFKFGNRLAYCAAIRRQALLQVGGYSPRMVEGYEDLHLWVNLLSIGKKVVTTPETLLFYRTKEQSMWTEAKSKYHEKLMEQIRKDFPNTV